jgi:hypothetical protein
LSLAGALTTLGIAGFFLVTSPLVNGEGISGNWERVTYGIILGSWGLVLAYFAEKLRVDESRHMIWGGLVVAGNALTGIFIMGTYTGVFIASSYIPSSLTLSEGLTLILMMASPAVGVIGGLLGVFWKRSWKQGAAIPGLAGASRRTLVGGVLMFFMVLPLSLWYPFSSLAAFLVLVFSFLTYRGLGNARLFGVLIIVGSLLAGYPFYGGQVQVATGTVMTFPVYVRSPFYLYTRIDPVWTTWAFIGLAGLILAVIGGVQTLRWKEIAP